MNDPKKISIGQAEEIIRYYFDALGKSHGLFNINLLSIYTIQDVIKSFKILNAYKLYNKTHTIDQIKKFAKEDSASIMRFYGGFMEQESEKVKLNQSKSIEEYMTDAIRRCLGDDGDINSFFIYCTQIDNSTEFWELVYSALHISYDLNDALLSAYFNRSNYDLASRSKFLTCLISFELAMESIKKGNSEFGFDELDKTYQRLKDLKDIYNNNSTFHYYKGCIELFYNGSEQNAANSFTKSININPNFGFAFYRRAKANSKLGNKKQEHDDHLQAERLGVKRNT